MSRGSRAIGAGLSLGLSLLAAASTNAAPSPVRSPHERAPSSQARGVRTYGPGATRIDRAEPPRIERSPFGSVARSVEPAIAATRKISGVPMVGSVRSFAVSPNGTYAIYIADQEVLARTELYSVRVDGTTAPIKLSAGLPFGAGDLGVSEFQISADSARVVFRADANAGNGSDDLFSAPIDGSSAAVQLNLATQRPVTAFGLAPSSAWALFLGPDTAFGGGGSELYAASIATAVSAKQISDARRTIAAGGVVFADFSPDSVRAIYSADAVADGVYQWFSVPLAAAAPGSDVQLSLALGTVALAAITPNGAQVVYTADERVLGQTEIFSIPIAGGTKLRLDATMAGDGVVALSLSPDGTRIAYLADQTTAGVIEVYGAQVGVASSAVRLNTPLAGTQVADNVNAGPDSATVLYEADQSVPGTVELYRVAFTGGTPTVLHSLVVPYDAGYFQDRGTPVFGRRAVYPVFGTAADLYSVPFDGSGAFLKLNDPLVSGQSVQSAFLPAQGARLMAFGVGASGSAVTPRIFAVPIRRDLAPESLNPAVGTLGVLDYAIAAGEKRAVYLQDQDTSGKPELYSRDLDSDADTVINAADNCPFVANLAQGAVVFGQTVLATTKTRFDWSTAADVRYVRGPLASLSTYVTNLSGTLTDAVSFTDATVPASGTGSYYLFAPDCTGRSYQSTLGKEPGRDAAAFP